MDLAPRVFHRAAPRRRPGAGRRLPVGVRGLRQLLLQIGGGPLCEPCWRALPRHAGVTLPLRAAGRSRDSAPAGAAGVGHQVFAAGSSLGPYEGSLRTVIHALKYAGRRRAAARLAEALLETAATRQLVATSDVLVAVPLHPQAPARARLQPGGAARARDRAPHRRACCPDALVRRLDTVPQTGLQRGGAPPQRARGASPCAARPAWPGGR